MASLHRVLLQYPKPRFPRTSISRIVSPEPGLRPDEARRLEFRDITVIFVEKSILVVTEGLGQQRFHGRVVLLVNEHTASAGEMVSAFAEENSLATIVGANTPGRLLSGSAY
jgi:hypothetical protein